MYVGPPIDDAAVLDRLPAEYRHLLAGVNGYVAYHGGLHVRGACHAPEWHSLRAAWDGPNAFHRLYPDVQPGDVPFAEDALGDQFLLRDGLVHRLEGETGVVSPMGLDLAGFDSAVRADPVGFLALEPLERFRAAGGVLEPGQLLSAVPPFCVAAQGVDVSLRAIAAADRIGFLASFAAQIRDLPDGTPIRFDVPV